MKVSIICPTFNGGDLLKKSLNAILNQKFDQPYEIIFVDSSSNDGTAEHLNYQSEIHEHLHLYNIDQSEFEHGKTRNFAISKSSGELIVLLTQDAIPANDYWLAIMVDTLESKDIAGVFGRHIAHKNHPKLIHRDLDIHFNRMNETPIRKIEDWNSYKDDASLRQRLHFFSNNNSALKRNIWEKSPFPEVDYGEDQTWAKKVIEKGYSLAYQHDSIVHHSHNFSLTQSCVRNWTEKNFYLNNFGYNLRINKKRILSILFSSIKKDFLWLLKTNQLKPREIVYSFKKNISAISF
jgi:rhamnosyltransferase